MKTYHLSQGYSVIKQCIRSNKVDQTFYIMENKNSKRRPKVHAVKKRRIILFEKMIGWKRKVDSEEYTYK